MFTWICPKCGREVPPAYNECPDCANAGKTPPTAAANEALPPPSQQEERFRQLGLSGLSQEASQQPEMPRRPPPPERPPAGIPPTFERPAPRRSGPPTWLMAILFAFAFVGLGGGIYWLV